VQAALDRRRQQISELRTKSLAAEERAAALRDRVDGVEGDRRRMEQEVARLRDERDHV
jgi:chromosome segregation ATPase